ncbi:RCC2-like protein [Leptotrombidium deliense]|uniref:RCC2-like protein n=1 Tax=Leptotrombidium deliense TaxID=299467 RepID=A0A443SPB1_9ACAR|nr:RCC2-like protein [Leptotrombidium deliense]
MPQKKKGKKSRDDTNDKKMVDKKDDLPKSKRMKVSDDEESKEDSLDGTADVETKTDISEVADKDVNNQSENSKDHEAKVQNNSNCNDVDEKNESNGEALNDEKVAEETKSEKTDAVDSSVIAGALLICGGTNWDLTGRKDLPKSVKPISTNPRNLWGPHRWRERIRIKEVISSCSACHSVIITDKGQTMTFGRNDKGQLGLGDTTTRFEPVFVDALKNEKIISAAVGKGHTLFLNDKGVVFATGDNKMGQLGIGTQSSSVLTPTKISYTGRPVVKMSCGQEFSMIVDAVGGLYSFGSPEYGQLGHNSEGKYFTTGNKISYHCETAPRRIVVYIEKTREGHIIPLDDVSIVDVACGNNHTLAIDTKKRCFSWGFAGYGRLGHSDTKNEMMPRNLKSFDYINRGVKRIWAGSTFSLALDENGNLYFWGQTKSSGEATMYPKSVQDLNGWHIRSVAAANKSIVVAADDSVISWGPSPTYGELGYGENKAKSSTTPQELKLLEGIYIHKISCGYGHTLMIADESKNNDLIEKLPKWP